ncbi:MAG: squalene/phytoene synthase family protein [Pseudomonadota bacterium]
MPEATLDETARLVERADPTVFRATLFAPEPARSRLMTLAAFDIELSRAAARAPAREEGPLLAEMRLQFWRDRVEAAAAGQRSDPDTAHHEVAGPLQALLAGRPSADVDDARAMIEARLDQIEGLGDEATWDRWADRRFGARQRLALALLDVKGGKTALNQAAAQTGRIAAHGFTLRNAVPAAQDGQPLLPSIQGAALAALQRGRLEGEATMRVDARLREAGSLLTGLRDVPRRMGRAAMPALLPLIRDRRTIETAARHGLDAAASTPEPGAVAMLWAVITGRL